MIRQFQLHSTLRSCNGQCCSWPCLHTAVQSFTESRALNQKEPDTTGLPSALSEQSQLASEVVPDFSEVEFLDFLLPRLGLANRRWPSLCSPGFRNAEFRPLLRQKLTVECQAENSSSLCGWAFPGHTSHHICSSTACTAFFHIRFCYTCSSNGFSDRAQIAA